MQHVCHFLLGAMLFCIMTGPWWWMKWWEDKNPDSPWKVIMWSSIAACLTVGSDKRFWEKDTLHFWSPNAVLFSNDGPYGVMNSQWLGGAIKDGPCSPMWYDTHWLGLNAGSVPADFHFGVLYLLYNPTLLWAVIFSIISLVLIIKIIKHHLWH